MAYFLVVKGHRYLSLGRESEIYFDKERREAVWAKNIRHVRGLLYCGKTGVSVFPCHGTFTLNATSHLLM
jgi:hypothetical protein